MVRLLSPPGIVTGLVVMLSVAGGVAFGAGLAGAALVADALRKKARS